MPVRNPTYQAHRGHSLGIVIRSLACPSLRRVVQRETWKRGCAYVCVWVCICVCVWNTSGSRRGEVQRGDLFLSLVKWPPVFAAVLEKDYQACNSRLADSVTRTPLVCATRVAVVNVSIVRSRGPRGGMSNDLILATRQEEEGEGEEGESAEARPTTIRFLLRFVYRTKSSL